MNISNKLKRVKAQADHLFLRGERTDVVGELRTAEYQAEGLRLLCDSLKAAIERSIVTHNTPEDKRMKKLTENNGSEILKDYLTSNANPDIVTSSQQLLLWGIIDKAGECQQTLNQHILQHDVLIEKEVLAELNKLIKEDFANYAKMKKLLKQYGQDLDTARIRYRNSTLQTSSVPSMKVDTYKEEMDEAESRLEQCRDNYACELYSLLAKERFICDLVEKFMTIRQDFFINSHQTFDKMLPKLQDRLGNSTTGPVFGCCLNKHLLMARRTIALPIDVCVKRLVEIGLVEEGLFRIAGSASKVKRLKAAFDANKIDSSTFSSGNSDDYNRDYDVHVIAGVLKSYLRELKEPLLTYTLHTDFLDAARIQDRDESLRKLWTAVHRLPRANYENLSYFMQFLSLLTDYQQHNKMTPNNIAIVIAPNLIWSPEENKADDVMGTLGRNMSLGNHYRHIVEVLVENSEYFFRQRIKFEVPKVTIPPVVESSTSGLTSHNGTVAAAAAAATAAAPSVQTGGVAASSMHRRNKSADLNKLDMSGHVFDPKVPMEHDSPKQPLRRKKQAPLPPQGTKVLDQGAGNSSSSSPEQPRSQLVPTREAPTPQQNRMYPPIPSVASNRETLPQGMSKSTPSSENLFNASNSTNPPVPAARVYSTVRSGSVRKPNRPSAEPPKPPLVSYNRNQESKSPVGGALSGSSSAINSSTEVENGHSHGIEVNPTVESSAVSSANIGTSLAASQGNPSSVGASSVSSSGGDGGGTAQTKPPRPTPPALSSLEKSSSAALLLHGESTTDVSVSEASSSGVTGGSSTAVVTSNTTSSVVASTSTSSESFIVPPVKTAETKDSRSTKAPIGFELLHHGDASSESVALRNKPNQVDENSSESSLAAAKVFRKSLENVIQQQASGHPVVLPRHTDTAGEDNSTDPRPELATDGESDEQVAKFATPPVPAARTFKENLQTSACEKPEPAPRVDKPALPDKPMTLPRLAASDRPPLAPRPSSNPNVKYPPNSSASTAGASSSSEENLCSSSAQPCDVSASSISACTEEDGQASPITKSSDQSGIFNRKAAAFGGNRSTSSGVIKSKVAVSRKLTPHAHPPAADPLFIESCPKEAIKTHTSYSVNASGEGSRSSVASCSITGDATCDVNNSAAVHDVNSQLSLASPKPGNSNNAAVSSAGSDVQRSPCVEGIEPNRVQDRVNALVKRSSEGTLTHKSNNSNKITISNQDVNSNNNIGAKIASYGGIPATGNCNISNAAAPITSDSRVARSTSCDVSQRPPGVRTSIHALQNQIFGGTTLEPAGGQIIIRKKADSGGQNKLHHPTPDAGEGVENSSVEAKSALSAHENEIGVKKEKSSNEGMALAEKSSNNRFPLVRQKLLAANRFAEVCKPSILTSGESLTEGQRAKNKNTSRSMDEIDQISESESASMNRNSMLTRSVHGVSSISKQSGEKSSLEEKNNKNRGDLSYTTEQTPKVELSPECELKSDEEMIAESSHF